MPDRTDPIENLFSGVPSDRQYDATYGGATASELVTANGHFATPQELLDDPQTTAFQDVDPVIAKAEKFLAGYLSESNRVDYPWPLPGPTSAYPIANGPMIVKGFSFIPSGACIVQLYDGGMPPGYLAKPFLQIPVPAAGLTMQFGRVLFPHGMFMIVNSNPAVQPAPTNITVDGSFIVEREWDSILK